MPIYDNNGTTNYEIGKLYDNDGTTNYQIGKVHDNDGTTNRLIYGGIPDSIIVNGVFTGDTALVTPPSVMSAWNYEQTGTLGGVDFNGGLWISSNNNYNQKTVRTCPTPIDFTDINKMICTVRASKSYDTWQTYSDYGYSGGTYIYVVSSPSSQVNFITNGSDGLTSYSGMLAHSKCIGVYSGDIEIDVSGISGTGYIGFAQVTCAVTQSAYCTVSNIKFE